MTHPAIDIIIPTHKKDLAILEYCIEAAKKKIAGARRIIVISKEKYSNNAEWFDEALFPFSFEEVASLLPNRNHVGWNYQQLLKLYAPLVIPGVADNVLILDSDTVFFRKVKMFDKAGRPFYNISKDKNILRTPFDIRVSDHIDKLFPAISRKYLPSQFNAVSGICHNMIFNRKIISELFAKIENYHKEKNNLDLPFYKLLLKFSSSDMSLSEYQIYFNYIVIFHEKEIAIRKLKYKNTADFSSITKYRWRFKYHYCSFHSYLRGTKTKCNISACLKKIFKKLFLFERWNIGIVEKNITEFLTIPNQEIKWLAPRCRFRADPFGLIDKNNKKQIFFESYSYITRRGFIKNITLDGNLKIAEEKIVLQNKSHLSYPYIFNDGKKNYALVESYKSKALTLYEVDENNNFVEIKKIFSDLEIVDPSIIKYNEKWWLFFNQNKEGDDKLFLAYSDDLFGEFKMHKKNPIKMDIASARSGGQIFLHKNSLYRPAQNCEISYGRSLVINRITEISEENFTEIAEIEITPNQLGPCKEGLHNISKLGENFTLVDGRKYVFAIYKPLIGVVRMVKRVLGCSSARAGASARALS